MIELRNEFLYATIAPEGGALTSIVDLSDGENLLYTPDGVVWDRCDAVLFPFVGRQKNGFYLAEGEKYEVPIHGIAPYSLFTLTGKGDDYAELMLTSDENTLRIYPYDFVLKVRYALSGKTLSVSYSVYNPGERTMYFFLGSHPALRIDVVKGKEKDDASGNVLDFNSVGNATYTLRDNFIYMSELIPDTVDLEKSLFTRYPSLVMERKSDTVTLRRKCGKTVDVVSDSPIICVWSDDKRGDLVAVESWWGLPDFAVETERELKNKKFINSLESKREFKCGYKLEFDNRR